jgi:hypothetical protein
MPRRAFLGFPIMTIEDTGERCPCTALPTNQPQQQDQASHE